MQSKGRVTWSDTNTNNDTSNPGQLNQVYLVIHCSKGSQNQIIYLKTSSEIFVIQVQRFPYYVMQQDSRQVGCLVKAREMSIHQLKFL